MTTTLDLRAIARELLIAQDEARTIAPITSRFGAFDVSSGYAVADLIHRARLEQGAVPVGRKIGFTNREMWARYGVRDPFWAYVYDTTVVHIGAERATCRIGRFAEPKIEPEIVLHFRVAPPVGSDAAAILACVDWVAHAFEIVQSHYPAWEFRGADAVADSGLHATLLVGEPCSVERLGRNPIEALEQFTVALSRAGELCAEGKGANVLGNPLAAAAHLVAVLATQPQYAPVGAGEIVTTGTITAAQSIRPGETWSTQLHGISLAGLSVELTD